LVTNENVCKAVIIFFEIHFNTDGELCKWCLKSFSTKGNLNRHIRSVHLKENWVCDMCGRSFHEKQSLLRHKRNIHQDQMEIEESESDSGYSENNGEDHSENSDYSS